MIPLSPSSSSESWNLKASELELQLLLILRVRLSPLINWGPNREVDRSSLRTYRYTSMRVLPLLKLRRIEDGDEIAEASVCDDDGDWVTIGDFDHCKHVVATFTPISQKNTKNQIFREKKIWFSLSPNTNLAKNINKTNPINSKKRKQNSKQSLHLPPPLSWTFETSIKIRFEYRDRDSKLARTTINRRKIPKIWKFSREITSKKLTINFYTNFNDSKISVVFVSPVNLRRRFSSNVPKRSTNRSFTLWGTERKDERERPLWVLYMQNRIHNDFSKIKNIGE